VLGRWAAGSLQDCEEAAMGKSSTVCVGVDVRKGDLDIALSARQSGAADDLLNIRTLVRSR
jgi:hypothetical protein